MTTTELRTPPKIEDYPDVFAEVTARQRQADPYPSYARMRRDYPVAGLYGMVAVYRYDDVAAVLRHRDVSTDDRRSTLHRSLHAQNRLGPAYLSQMDDRSLLHRDPPEHTRLRRLAAAGFTPARVASMRGFIQRYVDDLLDTATAARHLDLVADLAYPLPIAVISELLGIPAQDRQFVATWPRTQLCCSFESASANAAGATDPAQAGNLRQAEADRIEKQLTEYFAYLIDYRREHPCDDLTSVLIAAEEDGERLSVEEINATLRLLFVAGYENAVNLIGHGMLALLQHPEQFAELRRDPSLAAGAVNEALRYDAPFQFTRRIATAELDIGGYRIPKGQTIIAYIAAANRDPDRFADPDRFDIHRTDTGHLAFGTGIHACLGGSLARLQAEITFATLAQRLDQPRLDTDPPAYRTDVFRSLDTLPVSLAGISPAA